jgi:hypothetical protein
VGGGPSAGFQFCSQPSATFYLQGGTTPIVDLFVQGCDSKLWHINFDGVWHSWEAITPTSPKVNPFVPLVASAPSALAEAFSNFSPTQLHVVFSDYNDNVWDAASNDLGWSYVPVTGIHSYLPTAAPNVAGAVAVFAPDTDNSSDQQLLSQSVSEVNQLSDFVFTSLSTVQTSPLPGAPLTVVYQNANNGNDAVFYRTAAGHIAYQMLSSGFWFGSERPLANDVFAFDPVSVYAYGGARPGDSFNAAFVFAAKADGSIWYTYLVPL